MNLPPREKLCQSCKQPHSKKCKKRHLWPVKIVYEKEGLVFMTEDMCCNCFDVMLGVLNVSIEGGGDYLGDAEVGAEIKRHDGNPLSKWSGVPHV